MPPSTSSTPSSRGTLLSSAAFAWSIYPPPTPQQQVPDPLHPYLDVSNYLASPLSVLWAAGYSPASLGGAATSATKPRQGFIFVSPGAAERDGVEWVEREVRGAVPSEGRAVVWVLKRTALATRGMCDLGLLGGDVLTVL
ncbi:uncharacterized protein JCM10292_003241 [Rhodotorula paludigena]|uniref:uncharacterized protein n=1 Tax=Rhodotorula paludigena TaxID=86838 RepID=UPI003179A00E